MGSFKDMIGKALGLDKSQTQYMTRTNPDKEVLTPVPNRRMRRFLGTGTSKGYHQRNKAMGLRARPVTGRPELFKQIEREELAKSILREIGTGEMLDDVKGLTTKAKSAITERYPNVYSLALADRDTLIALDGVAEGTLAKIQVQLREHNVNPAWARD